MPKDTLGYIIRYYAYPKYVESKGKLKVTVNGKALELCEDIAEYYIINNKDIIWLNPSTKAKVTTDTETNLDITVPVDTAYWHYLNIRFKGIVKNKLD